MHNHKVKMKHLLLAFLILFPFALNAQKSKTFRQHDMAKWGVPAGNYSGIAHIEGDRYALISDKQEADGWHEVSITFKPSGDVKEMAYLGAHYDEATRGKARDAEGIVSLDSTLFVSAENDQRIIEIDLEGKTTGRELRVPQCFSKDSIFPNLGFEALAYDKESRTFWTTTEQSLRMDAPSPSSFSRKEPALLRLLSFNKELEAGKILAYYTDAPKAKHRPRNYAFGVPEITVLNDSTLLILEREFYIAKRYNNSFCNVSIYRVRLPKGIGSQDASIMSVQEESHSDSIMITVDKSLVAHFRTSLSVLGRKNLSNYEGMCLGPLTPEGRQTLILISDSQNRYGNSLFRLKDNIRTVVL